MSLHAAMADPAALTAAADAALQRGDYVVAADLLNGLVSMRQDDVRLLLNFGGALKELARFDEALSVLTRAVTLDPRRHGAWSNLGTVCIELQRYDDAVAAFANALRLKPDHGPALSGMGVTLRRRGLPREARRDIARRCRSADRALPRLSCRGRLSTRFCRV